jgi:hypothetical protein
MQPKGEKNVRVQGRLLTGHIRRRGLGSRRPILEVRRKVTIETIERFAEVSHRPVLRGSLRTERVK